MTGLRSCQLCPRLVAFRQEQKRLHPDYHCLPVAPSGSRQARLLIVGLAPGLHGANASGKPFCGDASGNLLFEMLQRFGFASSIHAEHADLIDCRITNAVKCLPPQNRPKGDEINRCSPYLVKEIALLRPGSVILALGVLAHKAVLKALQLRAANYGFGHAGRFQLENDLTLIDSYHCSRYNINTGRLTAAMFAEVFHQVRLQLR